MDFSASAPGHVRFGVFDLDLRSGDLRKAGARLNLPDQPLQFLTALLNRPGELVTRDELRQRLWPEETFVDFEHGLNAAVKRLRDTLGDSADTPRFIETVPRRGYRFIAPVDRDDDRSESHPLAVDETPISPDGIIGHLARQPRVRIAGGVVVTLLAIGAGWTLLLGDLMWGRSKSTRHSDPSGWVPLTDFADAATQPALSSDGRLLTFIRGPSSFMSTGQVYVKVLPNGEPAALTHDAAVKMSPTFTPDGASITYSVATTWDTWIVPVGGGPSRLMLPNASGLTWIDPHHLLFSELMSGRHMRVVTASSTRSDVRDVYAPPHDVDMAHRSYLSPDGSRVLVAEMEGEVHGESRWLPCRLVPFDGRSRGAPVGPPGLGCTSAAWSPEGRWMYFVTKSTMGTHIWRQLFPDGTPEQLTSGPSEEDGIAMAPDGRSLVTSVGAEQTTVWIHTAAGDRQITSEGSAFLAGLDGNVARSVFSPDGKKLYYLEKPRVASGTTSQELWIADLDQGRSERALTDVHMTGYDISPDGQRVVYAAPDATRGSRVWMARLDRTVPPQPLGSSSAFENRPTYGPGGLLFFQATESGRNFVYRMREDGSERIRVSPSVIEFIGVSPDGQWVVAQVPVSDDKTPRGIVAYSIRDGSSRRVCYGYCQPSWSPDGRSFNVRWMTGHTSQDDFRTLVIPLQAGQVFPPLPLAGLASETDVSGLRGTTVVDGSIYMSPDHATYAFSRRTAHRNLYRIPVP
jgi:DNA-binding winged helix-turn-helix (wHTH) protein/Tol biopolymer transport system component